MTHQTQTFTITDPRGFDGDPYEVAERAMAQAAAIHTLYRQALQDAYVMSRNAEMERQITADGEPDAAAFEDGPHGQRFDKLTEEAKDAERTLRYLTLSAGFNPKGRLGG